MIAAESNINLSPLDRGFNLVCTHAAFERRSSYTVLFQQSGMISYNYESGVGWSCYAGDNYYGRMLTSMH